MTVDSAGVERALGSIGTTFRLARLYPPGHPALVESMRQISGALPALVALGTVEWKVGATGFHWQGHQLLPRNPQVTELAGLLFARGIRAVQLHPGVTTEQAMGLFGIAMGTVPPSDAALGQIVLTMTRRSQRHATQVVPAAQAPQAARPSAPVAAIPPADPAAAAGPATEPAPPALAPRQTGAFRLDAVPVEIEVQRAIADVGSAAEPEAQRAAIQNLERLMPALLGLKDLVRTAAAIAALDHLLGGIRDPGLTESIETLASTLAEKPVVERMVARLTEPRVAAPERDTLVNALAALATLSVQLVVHAYLGTAVDEREPYRAVIRRAGERALEPLLVLLGDMKEEAVLAAAAELTGLTGVPQSVGLLVPLLRHSSEFVREAAVNGLGEIGGREISRPLIPSLKDESVSVRGAAARAIAAAGDSSASIVLIRRLDQESDEAVLAELLRSIGRLGGGREVLDVLARHAEPGRLLRRRTAVVRAAAVEAMARFSTREARGLLELYSHDKEPAVRKAAETALR